MPDLTKSSVRPRFDEWYAWCQKETNQKMGPAGREQRSFVFFWRSPKVPFFSTVSFFYLLKTVCNSSTFDRKKSTAAFGASPAEENHLDFHRRVVSFWTLHGRCQRDPRALTDSDARTVQGALGWWMDFLFWKVEIVGWILGGDLVFLGKWLQVFYREARMSEVRSRHPKKVVLARKSLPNFHFPASVLKFKLAWNFVIFL